MGKDSYHVVPDLKGGWAVKRSGAERASKRFENKNNAVSWARAKSQNEESELVIHKRDGTIQQKHSYGRDTNPPHDKKRK